MSNTSDQTTKPNKATRLIIDEIGVDTETGIIGRGHSYDNGKTFVVDDTIYGRVYHADDHGKIWKGIQDKVKTVVEPAKSAADSAVAYANDAIEKSKVNSQAIDDINSAVSDAVSDAAVARSDGLRAWNAAQSNVNLIDLNYASASASISSARTEALAAADEAKKSASAAQADIVVVKSSVAAVQADVTATRSDVAVAKSNIADTKTTLAQTASDLNSKITGVETSLADTTSALSDAKTAFNSDVAEAKNLANAAQTTADSAIKSASSVANDLTAVASQAKSNADGITKVTSDVGLLQTTVADNSGNISTIQETAKQIQQAVSDNAGNITVAKQTADSAVAVASDAKSNATVAIQTASGASLTAINANSDATVAKQTASEAIVQASNAESNFAQLSIRANKIEANVANNSGAIASVQQTANGLTTTVADIKANGGGVNLLTGTSEDELSGKSYWNRGYQISGGLQPGTTYTLSGWARVDQTAMDNQQHVFVCAYTSNWSWSASLNIDGSLTAKYNTVTFTTPSGEQQFNPFVDFYLSHPNGDSSKDSISGTGYISKLMLEKGTVAHDWSPAPADLQNQFTQTKQSIDGIATTINDPKTGLNATYQTAAGNATTISNVKGDVSQLKVSASSASVALSDAASNISSLQATASELETKYADAAGDISTLQADAKGMTQTISNAQGDIANLKTRADGFDTQFANINGDINKIQTNATGVTQTLTNAKSDIAVLQSRADGLDAKYATAAGDINTLKADANGFSQTLTNAQGDISTLKSTVSGVQTTLTDAQGNISTLQSDVSGLKKTTSDNAGNIATLQATANTLTSQMSSAQGDISTLKQTSSDFSSQVSGLSDRAMQNRGTVDSPDFNSLTQAGYYTITSPSNGKNYPTGSWGTLEVSGQVTDNNGRLNQKYVSDNNGTAYTRQYNANTKGWTAWVKVANQNDIDTLNGKITANTTAIEQNKQAIALKADQTTVDKTNGTVQQLQSQLQVQAGQIASKVSSSDLDARNYATQTYTQTQIKQTSDSWNANLASVKDSLTQSYTNLHATVDGIQAQVYNSDGTSKITQLSNLIATKVSSDDFNNLSQSVNLQTLDSADINNMKTNGHYFVHNLANNPIGGWVYVDVTGNGNDRIRQDVYQDSGIGHKYRRLFGTSWTNWEEGATESQITQLSDAINLRVKSADLISQINLQAGTALIQSNKLVLDAGTTVITGEAFIPSAAISSISADKIMLGSSALWNTDGTLNLVNTKDGTTSKIIATQGNVDFDGTEKNASVIHFASDSNTNAFTITPVGATVTPTLFFERFDQTPGHWLGFTRNETEHEGVMFHTWDDDGERFFVDCHARFNKNLRTIGTLSQGSWDGTTAKPEAGILTIKSGNTIWSGSDFLAVGSNVTGTYTGVWAKAFVQQSTLSAKTNIETVDPKYALDLVNKTDIRSYQYKSDVAQGYNKRYTSLIIDDVNDVSKYYAPNEFTNEERTGRDDGSAVGYLFLAVKELTKRIENLEEKLNG